MPFDPHAYAQELDAALGGYGRPAGANIPGVVPYAPPSARPTGLGDDSSQAMPPAAGSAPGAVPAAPGGAPGAAPGLGAGGGSKIDAKPPFPVKYDKSKLEGAKTMPEILDAMKPKSQEKYMDWWEAKYGSIQDKWDQVSQSIGQRPDAERPMDRKESFKMLMEFGIHMLRRSGTKGQGGGALGDAYAGHLQRRDREVGDYDQQAALATKGRQDELKGIGTFGDAMKVQSDIDQNAVQMEEAQARTEDLRNKPPQVEFGDDGAYTWNAKTKKYESVTVDGKRQTTLKVGSRGGSAASRDSRTAQQKNIDDLKDRGVPEQLALDLVYKRIADPRKAYATLYASLRRNFSNESEARAEADSLFGNLYGADWASKPSAPSIQKDDPLGLR